MALTTHGALVGSLRERPLIKDDAMQQLFLPMPLAADALIAMAQPVTSLEEVLDRKTQVGVARHALDAAIDTVELAIQQNHADYLAQRRCWTYEAKIAAESALRTMKRQRQHLQEIYGQMNRMIKSLEHDARHQSGSPSPRAVRFMAAAERLLAPATYQMILESAETP